MNNVKQQNHQLFKSEKIRSPKPNWIAFWKENSFSVIISVFTIVHKVRYSIALCSPKHEMQKKKLIKLPKLKHHLQHISWLSAQWLPCKSIYHLRRQPVYFHQSNSNSNPKCIEWNFRCSLVQGRPSPERMCLRKNFVLIFEGDKINCYEDDLMWKITNP